MWQLLPMSKISIFLALIVCTTLIMIQPMTAAPASEAENFQPIKKEDDVITDPKEKEISESIRSRFGHLLRNVQQLPKQLYNAIKRPKDAWYDFLAKQGKRFVEVKQRVKEGAARRYHIFLENLHKISELNLAFVNGEKKYEVEINHFADMTSDEHKQLRGAGPPPENDAAMDIIPIAGGTSAAAENAEILLDSQTLHDQQRPIVTPEGLQEGTRKAPDASMGVIFDWSEKGVVTPVPNQGICGSCWAFAATGAIESQFAMKHGKQVRFSKQQLLDCSTDHGYLNKGCTEGSAYEAFRYAQTEGITRESFYSPYASKVHQCTYNHSVIKNVKVQRYGLLPKANEEKLLEHLEKWGPVAAVIDAAHDGFTYYKSGIFFEPKCSRTKLNHMVLITGYGKDPETGDEFWVVRNSWSTSWGEGGYIRMARNKNNHCGIASSAQWAQI